MSGEPSNVGVLLAEGKTKSVHAVPDNTQLVLLVSKDRITAGNAARSHELTGKAAISTTTTARVFEILQDAGVRTHYVGLQGDRSMLVRACDMIPIEWVTRRVATGSFLKRHPGVSEGCRFCPPKLETFFKDDEQNDPQWSVEQILAARFTCSGMLIGQTELDIMSRMTVSVFEILEKAWSAVDCSLIDMKIEFGIDKTTKEILLADVIDSDSWRLWPSGDRRLMKDKQVYRDLDTVTLDSLDTVKRNFIWVADRLKELQVSPKTKVAVIMGSPADLEHANKVASTLHDIGISCDLRITSAHKGTNETMRILAEYEGGAVPVIFIAIAGRSNGLGPVLSGNTAWPVINCPPVKADWAAQDIWSSLRMPSGLGCATVLSPEAAAMQAAQMVALTSPKVWASLRGRQLNMWIALKLADSKLRNAE